MTELLTGFLLILVFLVWSKRKFGRNLQKEALQYANDVFTDRYFERHSKSCLFACLVYLYVITGCTITGTLSRLLAIRLSCIALTFITVALLVYRLFFVWQYENIKFKNHEIIYRKNKNKRIVINTKNIERVQLTLFGFVIFTKDGRKVFLPSYFENPTCLYAILRYHTPDALNRKSTRTLIAQRK